MKLEAEVIVTDGECVPSQRSLMKNERNPFLSKEIILLEEGKMRKNENTTFVKTAVRLWHPWPMVLTATIVPSVSTRYTWIFARVIVKILAMAWCDRLTIANIPKKAIRCCMNAPAAKTSSGISWHRIRNSQTILLSGWLKPLRITKKPKKTMLKAGLFWLSEQRTPYTTNCS